MVAYDHLAQLGPLEAATLDVAGETTHRVKLPVDDGQAATEEQRAGGSHPNSLYSDGVAALHEGETEKAIRLFREAITLRRGQPLYYYVLGHAHRILGDTDEAALALEKCVRLRPDFFLAKWLLGVIRIGQGNRHNGTRLCKEAARGMLAHYISRISLMPSLFWAWISARIRYGFTNPEAVRPQIQVGIGRAFEAHADPESAIVRYRRALALDADCFEALSGLGRALVRLGYVRDAIPQFERAVEVRPDNPVAKISLSDLLGRCARHERAIALAEEALTLAPKRIDVVQAKGMALYRAGDARGAAACFEAVLAQRPRTAGAVLGMARVRLDLGMVDEATSRFKEAIAIDPGYAEALRDLSMMRTYFADHPLHEQVAHALRRKHLPGPTRMRLHYAAGKLRDDIGAVDEAFEHYALANELTDSIFDPELHAAYFDSIMATFNPAFFAGKDGWGDPSETPVFIVGMPCSGTSLVEHLIAGHPQAHGSGERHDMIHLTEDLPRMLGVEEAYPVCATKIDRDTAASAAHRYLDTSRALDPEAVRIVDRTTINFQYLGLIGLLFPGARIIHCVRDPMDVCISVYLTPYFESHAFGHDLENIGFYHCRYERLMAHWKQVLPQRMLDVRYEDLVADPAAMARQIVDFCELPWDERCLKTHKTDRIVHSASSPQVRMPVYTHSVGRWKRYEKHLAPLRRALGEPSG